jgi:tRNA pseudouridine13 synthase
MKLRRFPDDFQVEELSGLAAEGGSFALYRLEKRSLGTLEAVSAIARRWSLPRGAIAFGGLKDKHAHTRQHLSIERGPRSNLRQQNFSLTYLGQAARAFHSSDISGNRFHIAIRNLPREAAEHALAAVAAVAADGAPNYFDDQRFGSLGESGRFVAQEWVRGAYEQALWLAVADANEHDSPDERDAKQRLRDNWSDGPIRSAMLRQLGRGELADHLDRRPDDFRSAISRLPIDDRGLYLAAFQSWIWNRMLAELLAREIPERQRQSMLQKPGAVLTYTRLTEPQRRSLAETALPLPSARAKPECEPFGDLVASALAPMGLSLRELRVKYPRDSFFSKGVRSALVFPIGLTREAGDDEHHPGRRQVTLRFDLPRGAYATMIVKQLNVRANESSAS